MSWKLSVSISVHIKRHPLSTYFALTFAISWGAIFIVVGPRGIPVTTEQTEILGLAMLMHVSLLASPVIIEPPLTGVALLTYILVWAAALWLVVAAVARANRNYFMKEAA